MSTLRNQFIETALSQVGVKEADGGHGKYISWYNRIHGTSFLLSAPWCAMFVSWCAAQAEIPDRTFPHYSSCTAAMTRAKALGIWLKGGDSPAVGDAVIFDWDSSPASTGDRHTGIVYHIDKSTIYTVEGNSGNQVKKKSYPLKAECILGYIHWKDQTEGEADDMATVISQIAAAAGMSEYDAILALATLAKFTNRGEDQWERDGVNYLLDSGLISIPRDGREMVEFGELGVILKKFRESVK